MHPLFVHDDAASDLDNIWKTEPDTAKTITALLEELDCNDQLREHLLEERYGSREPAKFQVQKWQEQWRQDRDLWRLKIWSLERNGIRYRIIYAYEYSSRRPGFHVLGIVHRNELDYDSEDHPTSKRILAAFHNL